MKKFNFTMGADPEFNLLMLNQRINARLTLQNILKKDPNFKEVEMGFKTEGGELGWDGADATGEIRPDPADNIEELVSNIKNIFKKAHEKMPNFDMSTLSIWGVIGGHVHFLLPESIGKNGILEEIKMKNLHNKLSSFYLPIALGENRINMKLRDNTSYGKWYDYRITKKTIKKENRFLYEMRCPSAEWLTTDKIARATLAYMGTVYNEIINHPRDFKKKCKDFILSTNESMTAVQSLLINKNEKIIYNLFNKIRKQIRTFEFYEEYKEEIEYILSPNKVLEDKRKVEFNIVNGWGLSDTKKKNKEVKLKELLSTRKTKKLLSLTNIENYNSIGSIAYNDDFRVFDFVTCIKEKIIAHKWNLKNSYFLFGQKRGIEKYIVIKNDYSQNSLSNGNLYLLKGRELINNIEDVDELEMMGYRINKIASTLTYNKTNTNISKLLNEIIYNKKNIEKNPNSIIYIGIPYSVRQKDDKKELIEIIYNIEQNKTEEQTIADIKQEITNTCNKEPKESILKKQQTESEIIFDNGSRTRREADSISFITISDLNRENIRNNDEEMTENDFLEHSYNTRPEEIARDVFMHTQITDLKQCVD